MRRGNEFEQDLVEMQFPDLADLDRPRSAEQWDAILRRIRLEVQRIHKLDRNATPLRPGQTPTDPASKSPDLPASRKYLMEVVKIPAARINAMSPGEILVRCMSSYYHELRDEVFKSTYLPYPEAQPLSLIANKRLKDGPAMEAADLARLFLPAVTKVRHAEVRIEGKLAALRAIEALRMHAATTGGPFPDTLDGVTIAPVPNDPSTGKPFEYRRQGQTATLSSRIPGLRYRVTLRK